MPHGYRVLGQDDEGVWCFERDEPVKEKKRQKRKGRGLATIRTKNTDGLDGKHCPPILRHRLLNTCPLQSSFSSSPSSRVETRSPSICAVDISSSSSFVAVGNDSWIEELAVECDTIDGMKILSFTCDF